MLIKAKNNQNIIDRIYFINILEIYQSLKDKLNTYYIQICKIKNILIWKSITITQNYKIVKLKNN